MRWFVWLAAAGLLTAAENVPRAEFPQPQFQRDVWLNLNGTWEFEFDDQDAGLREDWAATHRKFNKSITVPYCFESKLSGIGDASFHPQVWYRRSFTLPAEWQNRGVLLHFGAVDYHATVWVNGRKVGEHEGGSTPFAFEISSGLKPGANELVVRAFDPPTDRSIPRGKQFWEPKPQSIFYTRTSGIWQTVWLESVGRNYIDRFRIDADLAGLVRIESRLARMQKGLTLNGTVRYQGETVAQFSNLTAPQPVNLSAVSVFDPRRWRPESPNLYDLDLELRDGTTVLDRVHTYFGFRTVSVDQGQVRLNNNRITLKLILDQGYWPESLLTPPSDEAIQSDIRVTKEMGFNGVRKHQKLEDPRYLYWADKMGLIVSSEIANAYLFTDQYVERFTREWTEAVQRDINHPSILIWVPINESWGTPNLRERRQQDHLRAMYTLTHSLDDTRIVIDNDGWEHTEMTDLFAIHDYAATGAQLLAKYAHVKTGTVGATIPDNARPVLVNGSAYNGTPLYLSEFGGVAYVPADRPAPPGGWGYSGIEPTQAGALQRLQGLFSAAWKMPGLVGYCYTQLTDVEQEINGLLTYDRKLKFPVEEIRRMNNSLP